jgi:cardiolipin synthase A/B
MKNFKPFKYFAPAALILSLMPLAHAQTLPRLGKNPAEQEVISEILRKQGFSKREQRHAEERGVEFDQNVLGRDQGEQVNPFEIKDLSQADTAEDEKNLLEGWGRKYDAGTLERDIRVMVEQIKASDTDTGRMLQSMPPEKQEFATRALIGAIESTIKLRGLTMDSSGNRYREWSKLSEEMMDSVRTSVRKQRDILDLAEDSRWVRTEKVQALINGPASFAMRDKLMSEAKSSINILTWAIYDDVTGTQLADLLLKKKSEIPALAIRIIVDGQVAAGPGHSAQVARLEKAGIEVIRWSNPSLSYVGQHRKMLVVDDEHMVAGGLNFGDVYSHKNPDLKIARWRDTDVYVKGDAAKEANRTVFAKIWNDQIRVKGLKLGRLKLEDIKPGSQGIEVAVINNDPTESNRTGSKITLTVLKAIQEAKERVDIENAYIINFPALKTAVDEALKRGVRVRILTNSSESVDEPAVSTPILRTVADYMAMPNALVYTKKGATLHSKLLIVDSKLSMIMSHNLHPRSERMEGEMAVLVRDEAFATSMHAQIDQDVAPENAFQPKSQQDLNVKPNPVLVPSLRVFFDLL